LTEGERTARSLRACGIGPGFGCSPVSASPGERLDAAGPALTAPHSAPRTGGWLDRLPDLSARNRRLALAALLLMQVAYFFAFLRLPLQVSPPDNFRYEVPAWNLAEGRGISMPFELAPDAVVRGWVCTLHPGACANPEGRYPTALFPPGYTFMVAAVYAVAGRSLLALTVVHLGLLLLLFVLYERLAARLLQPTGYWFAVGVACAYPFLARQASWFMSDHLHAVLLFSAFAALYLMQPGKLRGAVFGFVLAAATLTRPYSLFALIALLAGGACWRTQRAARHEPWVAALAALVPMAAWALRNAYWFHRFIPFTTVGLGASLYTMVLESEVGNVYDKAHEAIYTARLMQFGDFITYAANQKLAALAVAWIREHPGAFLALVAMHVPKVWISLGEAGQSLSPVAYALAVYMGGLLLLGLVGGWFARKQRRLWPLLLTIVLYWGFLVISPEARRSLPLRLPMLLLAGLAVQELLLRWGQRARRASVVSQVA
jgi:hypothetical protein